MATEYQAMITQHSWMFLSSFEKLRAKLRVLDTVNMVHLGARAFEEIGGEVVQTTSFVLRKSHIKGYKGTYCRLIEPNTQQGKEDLFLTGEKRYVAQQDNFSKIPGAPVAYWASDNILRAFTNKKLGTIYDVKSGLSTGDNDLFLRLWQEISVENFSIFTGNDRKGWVPYNKGGGLRKWYGLNDLVVYWGNDADRIKAYGKAVFRNPQYYFREGITWSGIASSSSTFRVSPKGFVFDSNKGPMIFERKHNLSFALGLLNTKVVTTLLGFLNPTISLQIGDILSVPIPQCSDYSSIETRVIKNVQLARADWDSFETSWDFKRHPLL